MSILDRYIVANILRSTAVVGLLVVALSLVSTFLSEADEMHSGSYGLPEVLLYALLKVPAHVVRLLPVLALLGALIGLGRLATGSELVVMRSSGVSVPRLGVSVALAGLALALGTATLAEWVAPVATRTAETFRDTARYGERVQSVEGGWWLRADGDTVRIDGTLSGGALVGVIIYRHGEGARLRATLQAATARFQGGGWVLHDIDITSFHGEQVSVQHVDRMDWDIELQPQFLQLTVVEPNELSSFGLYRYIGYLLRNQVAAETYRLALWRHFVNPLTVLVLTLFALSCAFGDLRGGGAGKRLFLGGLAGLAFYVGNEAAVSSGQVYGLPAWLAASWPTLLLVMVTAYWLRRQR